MKLIHHPMYLVAFGGESLVGGLLGGLIGVETAKVCIGWKSSTGDDFVLPLIVGISIGRVGCFLAGLPDGTYGIPTNWITGVNFGDGIRRHPTQLYEIAFLLLLGSWMLWLYRRDQRQFSANSEQFPPRPNGFYFQVFMIAYLAYRLAVEYIKPVPRAYLGFSNIQLACMVGLAYYLAKAKSWSKRNRAEQMEVQHA